MEKLKPIGGIYTQVSSAFQRGVYEDNARCLKANTHDDGVVMEVMGVCDDQGRINKPLDIKDTVPTIRSETHGNIPKVTYDVSVEVKEATKKGYSVCRGGARFRQLHDAGKQDKARKSRGRYGKHIRHIMQSGHIRQDIRGLDRICRLVSEKAVLHSDSKAHTERMF